MSEQRVESVERALALLECFDRDHPQLSLAELAARSDLYKSTILRLAASLERCGYLVRRPDGRFRIGPTPARLAAIYREAFDLQTLIRPELVRLVERTGETASFYVRDGSVRVCLYRENSKRSARHHLDEGVTFPLDSGATGHVLRAFGEPRDPRDERWRSAGHAVSLGERDPDLAAIAVPVLGPDGRLYGALSVSGIVTRFSDDRRQGFIEALEDSAAKLRTDFARSVVPGPERS